MNETFMKEKPVLPLLLSMALPNVLSMLVNSLYNIVDSLFVARISEDAMTALSLVFPIQNFSNAIAIGFGIGLYDGVMGPGTGTFAIIAFTTLMGFDLRTANGNGKVLNLASNYASLFTYLMNGLVVFHIGIPCAISGIVGNIIGSHFALRKGAKFIRPMMLVVLVLLLGKIVSDAVL